MFSANLALFKFQGKFFAKFVEITVRFSTKDYISNLCVFAVCLQVDVELVELFPFYTTIDTRELSKTPSDVTT